MEEQKPKAPAPIRWKLAKGDKADIPGPHGMLRITNANLDKPNILKALSLIEAATGNKIFGNVIVKA